MPIHIQSVLAKIIESFAFAIEAGEIIISNQVDKSIMVNGLESYVYSVFHNVISNCIKYSDNRKKKCVIIQSKDDGGTVSIAFTDNGVGFDAASLQDKMYKPFTRFHSHGDGKGLGLYLIKIEMEAIKGSVDIVSKPDIGTTVTLTFNKATPVV